MIATLILIVSGIITFFVIPALVQIGFSLLFVFIFKMLIYVAIGAAIFFLIKKLWRKFRK